jgi:hypothetical protein
VDKLRSHGLVYLATPYTKYPAGFHMAAVDAARIAADLMRAGVKVYSPIVHTHPLALYGNLDPLDHSIWLPFDETIMNLSDACCIGADMAGWETSFGVGHEISTFWRQEKPVYRLRAGVVSLHREFMR